MEIILTTQQKQELESQHGMTRDKRVADRIKAILLAHDGWSAATIAVALRIHETTVHQHIGDYFSSGKLKPENGGSQSYLSSIQSQDIVRHLTENTYHCTHQIIVYIFECYGILYSIPGINKWLHHNGFSYKRRKGIPHKFDEAKQHAFIDAYKALKARCSKDESILLLMLYI